VSAQIQDGMSLFFQQFDDLVFQGKTCMIGPNGYAHLFLLKGEIPKKSRLT
jgi:hypothetical protein